MQRTYYISPHMHKFSLGKVVGMVPKMPIPTNDDLQFISAYDILVHGSKTTAMQIGHVTGFSINAISEYVVKVKWADGEEYAVHPNHLTVLG